jgi:hypothetical protein
VEGKRFCPSGIDGKTFFVCGGSRADELRYRDRLDASRMTPIANARRDLFEAMKQIADTGYGPKEQLPSMGCSIKWNH